MRRPTVHGHIQLVFAPAAIRPRAARSRLRWARQRLQLLVVAGYSGLQLSRRATTFRMLAATSPATASASAAMPFDARHLPAAAFVQRLQACPAFGRLPRVVVQQPRLPGQGFGPYGSPPSTRSWPKPPARAPRSGSVPVPVRGRSDRRSRRARRWLSCAEARARFRSSSLSRCDCAFSRVLAMRSSIAVTCRFRLATRSTAPRSAFSACWIRNRSSVRRCAAASTASRAPGPARRAPALPARGDPPVPP